MLGLLAALCLVTATQANIDKDWDKALRYAQQLPESPRYYEQKHYILACAYHGIGDKHGTTAHCARVLEGLSAPERRHEVICEILLRDVATWKDGDLGDVDRLAVRAADKLNNGRLPVKEQQEILDKLDKLIEEQERPPKDPNASNDSAPTQPQQESRPADMIGKGAVDQKAFEKLAKQWGTMPDKEREQVIQQMQRKVPDKYRGMIEDYLKSISR